MKALVTGIDGFAGRWLALHLLERGATVCGTHRPGRPPADPLPGVEYHPLDVADRPACRELLVRLAPDWCFPLAAATHPSRVAADPGPALVTNILGAFHVADGFGAAGGRVLVFPSTAHVYGTPRRERIDEDHPLDPQGVYGASKLAAEALVRTAGRTHGFGVVVLRLFNHFGPGQREDFVAPALARRLLACAQTGGPCRVGDLDLERDFTDVRDVAVAYRLAAEAGRADTVYNIGSGVARPLRELYRVMARETGTGARPEVDPALVRRGEVRRFAADPTRFMADTGWAPTRDFEATAREVVAELRAREPVPG